MDELRRRYKCFKCETKFYDLGRPLPVCPSCGENQHNRGPRQVVKCRRKRSSLNSCPDIHLVSGEHEDLVDHADPEGREILPEVDGEQEGESHHEEEYPLEDKELGAGEDGYRPD